MKDYKYKLSTKDVKRVQITTEKVIGKFGAIIVKSNGMWYRLAIYLKEHSEICIYKEDSRDMKMLSKDCLYAIVKTDSYNVSKLKYEAPDFWLLNDELIIELQAPKNISVDVTLRVID